MIYRNDNAESFTVEVNTGNTVKIHAVVPGQLFSFCQYQDNSISIRQQLETAGATNVTPQE